MSGCSESMWSLARGLMAVATGVCFSIPAARALPNGQQVTVGNAVFSQQSGALTVTNTPGTIINWQRFSIDANETLLYVPPPGFVQRPDAPPPGQQPTQLAQKSIGVAASNECEVR